MAEDEDLVERARAGDISAWASLYRLHAGRLVVWLNHTGPHDGATSAEDLAAESWLTAAEKIQGFRGGEEQFAGWLFGIARNHARNASRRISRRGTTPTGVIDDTLVLPVEAPTLEEQVVGDHWVRLALAQLPKRERDVIICVDVVGLDNASAAAALGISGVAVRVARHRGIRRLRRAADAAH